MKAFDSDVEATRHAEILTLVHRDAVHELDKLLFRLRGKDHADGKSSEEIKETTLFARYPQRTLLHVASSNGARACVKLLVNKPYSWNPDLVDGRNMTSMMLAEMRDDIAVLLELARHSTEERISGASVVRPPFGGLISTLLLWPQDLRAWKLTRAAIVIPRCVGISGSADDLEGHYVYRTCMIGPLVALCFELYISTPNLFEFTLWRDQVGSNVYEDYANSIWYIYTNELSKDHQHHLHTCTQYPHCLYLLGIENLRQKRSVADSIKALRNRWIVHRFGECDHAQLNEQVSFTVSRLADMCRSTIRSILVKRMLNEETGTHYVRLIQHLRLPPKLENFLLYYDIWDIPGWEQYLSDGQGGNVPYGTRLIARKIQKTDGTSGLSIGHRFVPLHSPD